ncbi:unnamed protein product [Phytomonas sp. Hart1]|nr:unnamed protein product [Phytomonas sp. Hart1]|eukprot:CCW68854.1 unnamed protein product [Phytomonas sp. isolate Hart1]
MAVSVSSTACMGCKAACSEFQCPLCQAEAHTVQGFFCSQKCFAENWLQHRNDFHKRGIVRESKGGAVIREDNSDRCEMFDNKTKSKKRSRNTGTESEGIEAIIKTNAQGPGSLTFPPWTPLPNPQRYLKERGVEPDLGLDCPRAIVGACVDDIQESFWPSLVAAAHYVASSVRQNDALMVLVVAGFPYSAHAFAWAARCAGLGGSLRMAVTLSGLPERSSQYFTPQKRVVVATEAVVGHAGSGAASLWLEGLTSLLVTLPDVVAYDDLQGVNIRSIFFVSRRPCKDANSHGAITKEDIYGQKGSKKSKIENNHVLARSESSWSENISYEEPTYEVTTAVKDMCCGEGNVPLLWQPEMIAKDPETVDNIEKDLTKNRDSKPIALSKNRLKSIHCSPCYIRPLTDRMDNDVSTALVNGDIAAALQHLIRVFRAASGYFEEVLFNSLRCDWGAVDVVHAHHRLAYLMRNLADHSSSFSLPKGATMADMVFRAMVPLVRMFPSLHSYKDNSVGSPGTAKFTEMKKRKGEPEGEDCKMVSCQTDPMALAPFAQECQRYFNFYSSLPNIQLQATIIYLIVYEPSPAALDTLAEAWKVTHYIKAGGLTVINRSRKDIIHRLRSRFKPRLGAEYAEFLVTLMHILYDTVAIYSLPLEDVACRLQWDLTLASDVGSLTSFLELCGLRAPVANGEFANDGATQSPSKDLSKIISNLSSRQVRPSSLTELLRTHEVRAETTTTKGGKSKDGAHLSSCFILLPWLPFPISGKRQRDVTCMENAAVDEVLMAMPREPRPMYIGDVGNLIGKWNGFNSRFGGVLGSTLSEFLLRHPKEFKVVGGLVSRVKVGHSEPVRIRFDNDAENVDDHNDSDDDNKASRIRKAQDHVLLTGINSKGRKNQKGSKLEKDLPARARKKRAIKEFNKQRFNRNYKPLDPSARVPGYVKHGPRKIKGRGKKVNMHAFKRG